jgi:hypothetical protein
MDMEEEARKFVDCEGSVSADAEAIPVREAKKPIIFTIRAPPSLIELLDADRKKKLGNVSLNQWIFSKLWRKGLRADKRCPSWRKASNSFASAFTAFEWG